MNIILLRIFIQSLHSKCCISELPLRVGDHTHYIEASHIEACKDRAHICCVDASHTEVCT